eukprot:gene25750-biopygen3020
MLVYSSTALLPLWGHRPCPRHARATQAKNGVYSSGIISCSPPDGSAGQHSAAPRSAAQRRAAPTQECSRHVDILLPSAAAMLCSGSVPRSAPPQPWLSPGSAAALGQHGVPVLH